MASYDVVVIGAGPGGYVAAIRCAQLGLKTACVDDWRDPQGRSRLGGTCLNVGCIPSKALLDSSHHYYNVQHQLPAHGIQAQQVSLDMAAMQGRKQEVVDALTGGVESLFLKHKIDWLPGRGRLTGDRRQIEVLSHDGSTQVVEAGHIIIATGSVPAPLAEAPVDGERVVDSTGALALDAVPKRLAVIGAGVIALELGSVWSRLGAKTVMLNRSSKLLARLEPELGAEAHRVLTAQGLEIRAGAKPKAVKATRKQVTVTYEDAEGEHRLQVDKLLVATGRAPNTGGLNAEAAGLELDERGFVVVDERCRTNLPSVYAIGDAVRGPMLAHKASDEGIMIAEHIAGQGGGVNYEAIPWVIYTWPEIGWVGHTSQELESRGSDFKAGIFPFYANGRARAMGESEGLVKVLSDARTDRVLGVHIIGPYASEMITEAVTVMEYGGSAEDIARTTHAHPTLSEAFREAALAVDGRPIHR